MNKHKKLLALLLVLVLMLALLPSTALAGNRLTDLHEGKNVLSGSAREDESDAEEARDEEIAEVADEEFAEVADEETAEVADEEVAEIADEEEEEIAGEEAALPELRTVLVEEGEICYAAASDLVYSNAGVVYANGATVYNNGGLVYLNGGLAFNNAGTVYANGGTVYNNGGKVYSNGAVVYTFGGDVETSLLAGYYRLTLPEGLDAFATLEGLVDDPNQEDALLMTEDAAVTLTAKEGYLLSHVKAENAKVTDLGSGSYSLSDPTGPVVLSLQVRVAAPVFSLAPGTYAGQQELEINAAEGAVVYYTLDGSIPDEETGLLCDGPITLDEGVTVTAVALAPDAEQSPRTVGSYAIVSITAPDFDELTEGYGVQTPQAFTVEDPGSVTAVIQSVALTDGDTQAFSLGSVNGGRINAGGSNSKTWTVCPAAKLDAGTYSATVTFTFEGGATADVELSFRVAEAPVEDAAETPAAEAAAEE